MANVMMASVPFLEWIIPDATALALLLWFIYILKVSLITGV